ncbi:MAG: carboxypeptidase regulatory-like domain-containing protein [Armatimonadetes bacterium]|nr:carboxypeptidase regulatory-like domain-containing protein [Armatimonadota bacterium]
MNHSTKFRGLPAALLGAALLSAASAQAQSRPPLPETPETPARPTARATGSLTGVVKSGEGGLKDAIVRVGSNLFTTGDGGAFSFEGIRAGNAVVFAHKKGYRSAVQRVQVSAEAPVNVELTLNQVPAPNKGKGTVHGRVVTEGSGDPVADATVTDGTATVKTDETGEFVLENVGTGETEVVVTTPGGETEKETIEVVPDVITEVGVETDGETETTSEPAPAASLSGTVTSSAGPVAKAIVRVSAGEDLVWVAKTDDQGKFTLEGLPVGAVKVVVLKGGFQSAEQEATLVENANTLDVTLVVRDPKGHGSAGTGSISGVVYSDELDESGNPKTVDGAVVMVRGVRVFSGPEGRYELTGLPTGKFNVQVWMSGFRHTHKKITLDSANPAATADITLSKRVSADEPDNGGDENVGDADSDGTVSVTDAVTTLRAALGLTQPTKIGKARADVAPSKPRGAFGDGEINIQDAIKLLRNAAGLEPVFP